MVGGDEEKACYLAASKNDLEDLMRSLLPLALLLFACGGPPKSKLPDPSLEPLLEPGIWRSAEELKEGCDQHLDYAQSQRDNFVKEGGALPSLQRLQRMNDILITLDRLGPLTELLSHTHPEAELREAADACYKRVMATHSEFSLDRGLFDLLAGISEEGLEPPAQRFLKQTLRDYRRAGVDRDEQTRERLKVLNLEIVEQGQRFGRNIREDRRFLNFAPEALEGLPEDFLKSHPPGENGQIRLSTDYPEFYPVMNYAKRESTRRDLYKQFLSRAFPVNEPVFKELLKLRHEYATLLGYPHWAAYNAEDKMVREAHVISEFIEKVAKIARPRMEKELEALLKRKQQDLPKAKKIESWDRFYYLNKLKKERFGVDAEEVRSYFDFARVKAGILKNYQEFFKVSFRLVPKAPVWHPEVEVYEMLDREKVIARFYLDMHPRPKKYSHAAMFGIYPGVKDRLLPMAALVTNFPKPTAQGGGFMEHRQVEIFFHEFGHLMHHLLGGQQEWVSLSGISCEWDFVEAPSQIMEEWAWDPSVLTGLSSKGEGGETIPAALVEKMRQAKEFGKGIHVMRQLAYAALSFGYYSRPVEGIDLLKVQREIVQRYSPYPSTVGTYLFASFGHLEGYSSMYYTYMWSLMLAKDLFSRFKAEGMNNPKVAADYRKMILEPGGSLNAAEMVKAFLGRPYNFEALKAWLEEN